MIGTRSAAEISAVLHLWRNSNAAAGAMSFQKTWITVE